MIEDSTLDALIDKIIEMAEMAEERGDDIKSFYRVMENALKELRERRKLQPILIEEIAK